MSPIHDPRFTRTRYDTRERELADGRRSVRMEYLKPLIMLLAGGAGVMMWIAASGGSGVLALVYPARLALELVCGVAGLWVASVLWLGGAGTLGLSLLRLAGIYAITDLLALAVAPLLILGWIIHAVVYVCLLAWLFDFDGTEAIMVAVITFVLKLTGLFAFGVMLQGLV